MTWAVEEVTGSAAAFHARPLDVGAGRRVTVLEVDGPALVLGSTQPSTDADVAALRAAGVELVRRRSGGGAVLLLPGHALWVDVDLPAGDPLWDDDVGRAAHWLGRAWAGALAEVGIPAEAHTGAMVRSRWSRLVCFAGLGPGEVTSGSRKVVGIAQRRTRHGARFQSVAVRRWEPGDVLALLALSAGDRAEAGADLAARAAGVGDAVDRLLLPLLARLP